ncbi:MAG: LysR family transcriptional regulator [Alphaproteobacteria bacterium]|nr:LysR family transcriptional regulator [Alphaproteobacteria bacterium]
MSRFPSPPFSALRAFDAAARLGGFRDAAAALGVTPSAISHQVRALEEAVGAPLFTRSVRAVALTPLGRSLHEALRPAFDQIGAALARTRAAARETRLKISALPLFVNVWLIPRLDRFAALHPEATIDIDTTNAIADFGREDVDIAIRSLFAPTPGLKARKLLDLTATPLCTPALARTLKSPRDLAGATLIHNSVRKAGWPEWLEAAGVKGLKARRNLAFDTVPSAVEAAAQGRGVLLGLMPIVFDAPAATDLVAPFSTPAMEAGSYYVVHRRGDESRALVAAFVAWLFSEMRADVRRLARLAKARTA